MRAVLLSVACSATVMVAGCGPDASGTFTTDDGESVEYSVEGGDGASESTKLTIKGPDGEEVVQETGADVPVDLPKGFSIYPGAKVISNTVIKQGDAPGSMIMLESKDDPGKIADYYKKQAEDAGLEIQVEANMGESLMVSAERESDGTTMMASASREEGATSTTAQLIVASKPGS